jgi:Uma2 family endonuclease
MAVAASTFTADDLVRMPDDGWRYELVRGELKKMPPAGFEHGSLTVRLTWPLAQHVNTHDLGVVTAAETGYLLATDPDTVMAPDIGFVRKERVDQAGKVKGYWPGVPDLAVEVISPNDTYTEVEEKAVEWLSAGCPMVLLLNPRRRTATLYRSPHQIELFSEGETLDLGGVVTGFSMGVNDIFD